LVANLTMFHQQKGLKTLQVQSVGMQETLIQNMKRSGNGQKKSECIVTLQKDLTERKGEKQWKFTRQKTEEVMW